MAKLNGEEFDILQLKKFIQEKNPSPPNLAPTIENLLIYIKSNRMVAVEVNGEVIDQEKFSSFELNEQDEIEIIQFVGGG